MDYNIFKNNCNEGKCLRSSFITKNCKKDYKQDRCYNKVIKKLKNSFDETDAVNQKDERWVDLCLKVNKRDGDSTCTIWRILSNEQRQFILEVYGLEFNSYISKTVDKAHIIPRSQSKELYYEVSNVINMYRYFHSLLDELKHPVTRSPISKEERKIWMDRALLESERRYKAMVESNGK